MFLIKVDCEPGWIRMFGPLSRKNPKEKKLQTKENQAICYSVDVAATNGTNLASSAAEAHAAWLFLGDHVSGFPLSRVCSSGAKAAGFLLDADNCTLIYLNRLNPNPPQVSQPLRAFHVRMMTMVSLKMIYWSGSVRRRKGLGYHRFFLYQIIAACF